MQRVEADVIRLWGERDATHYMLVPIGLGQMYFDMMQQWDRAEREVWEESYYREL